MSLNLPKIIFFDAGGTLFEVRGSVGEIYHRIAARHGFVTDAVALQRSFAQAFRQQPPLAFPPGLVPAELIRRERAWWRSLVTDVLGDASQHPSFDEYFAEVYEAFTRADAWHVLADVEPALQALRAHGVRMAVLSNFDSRLDQILSALGLAAYFDAVYLSTHCGAAKPNPLFFQTALRAQGVEAADAWHVGDAWREDVEGAAQAGMRAFWLQRGQASAENQTLHTRISTLLALTDG